MSRLLISEKHGVNPSVSLCFWCHKDKELLLLGKLKGDREAPRQAVYNYDPCDSCAEFFSKGIVFVAVVEEATETNAREIAPGKYPTGAFVVMTRTSAERLLTEAVAPEMRDEIMKQGKVYIEPAVFQAFFGEYLAAEAAKEKSPT